MACGEDDEAAAGIWPKLAKHWKKKGSAKVGKILEEKFRQINNGTQ